MTEALLPESEELGAELSALFDRCDDDGQYVHSREQVDFCLPYLLRLYAPSKKALTKSMYDLLQKHNVGQTRVPRSVAYPKDLEKDVRALMRARFAPTQPQGNVLAQALGIAAVRSFMRVPPGPLAHHAPTRRKKTKATGSRRSGS